MAVSGAAQAADLAIAVEPIDYVDDLRCLRCWLLVHPRHGYLRLKIGGYVQLDVWFYDDDRVGDYFNIASQLTGSVSPTADPSNPLAQTSGVVAGYLYAQDNYSPVVGNEDGSGRQLQQPLDEQPRRHRDQLQLRRPPRTTTRSTAPPRPFASTAATAPSADDVRLDRVDLRSGRRLHL